MARVVAIANQKGGVGKTTTTFNLAHALCDNGKKRVLVCDFDPQASLTIACGFEPHRLEKTVYDLLVDTEEELSPWTVIQATKTQEIRLLPSNIDLSNAEQQLVSQLSREHALKRVVDHLRGDFDLILIDCPPSLGLLMTNALTAADAVIIPVSSDYLSLRALEHLLPTIQKVRRHVNPALRNLGIVVTRHDRTVHAKEILEELRKAFDGTLFETIIPASVKAKDAIAKGESIFSADPESALAEAYRSLANEVDARMSGAARPQALGAVAHG